MTALLPSSTRETTRTATARPKPAGTAAYPYPLPDPSVPERSVPVRWRESITEFRGREGLQLLNRFGTILRAPEPDAFRAIRQFVPLDQLQIGSQRATPHRGLWNNPQARKPFEEFLGVSIAFAGTITGENHGRSSVLAGDAASLIGMGSPSLHLAREPSHLVTLKVPVDRLHPLAVRWLTRSSRRTVARSSLAAASRAFIRSILDDPPIEGSWVAVQLERTLVDLIEAVVFEAQAADDARDGETVLLFAHVLEAIEDASDRIDLTIEEVAAETRIEVQQLRRLLRSHGTTFGRLLADVRVERLASALETEARTPLGALALSAGFGNFDVASRAFKHVFGLTMSDFRTRAVLRRSA